MLATAGSSNDYVLHIAILMRLHKLWTDGQTYLKIVICSREDAEHEAALIDNDKAVLRDSELHNASDTDVTDDNCDFENVVNSVSFDSEPEVKNIKPTDEVQQGLYAFDVFECCITFSIVCDILQ